MRVVFERLEALDLPYYMKGSEALARYSEPRQTMDAAASLAQIIDQLRAAQAAGTWTGFARPDP